MRINDKLSSALVGSVTVATCPYNLDPKNKANRTTILQKNNLVVNDAQRALIGLMKGDAGFLPKFISIGSGGDFLQGTKVDTGAYVAAQVTDTALRNLIYRIPISMVTDEVDNTWTFVAIARPEEAQAPIINEFGVETTNQTLLSHVVSPPAGDGRATRYTKTSLEFLIIEWTYTFSLDLSITTQPPVVSV